MGTWRRLLAILAVILGIAIPIGAVAQNYSNRDLIIWALEQDAGSWSWNSLDRGSYGRLVEQPGYESGHHVYQMSYTYNGGREGWVEGYIYDGQIQSIRYHDNGAWSPVRTEGGRRAADSAAAEACRRRARADGLDTFGQCGW